MTKKRPQTTWEGIPSLQKYNGRITITSPTGKHRTFKIYRGASDDWTQGRRLVALLASDNRWVPFAWVWASGNVQVYLSKKQKPESLFPIYARMLMFPERFKIKGACYLFQAHCLRCNRVLTTPKSIARGMGPFCAGLKVGESPR